MDADLIKLVNKLQDTFANLGGELDMPQLAVVGSQSAGKSSVLETIVGRDFLPRGQGIVTRRPLVLQLIHTPEPSPDSNQTYREWGQFLHVDKRFTDFGEIRKEIEQETFRVAGQNKGISKLPITLRVYSPDVLDLTLVDLPGLTKIPVGDQPSDIERQIRNLIVDYISKPNCIILAVSPANVDLANSESLKLARSVDPQGRRTVGVLTKLDLMDAGTNALDILTGRVYPLKLGFIGVVNRSQLDINENKDLKAAHESEADFFRSHPAYRNIAQKNGTKYLAKTLNQVLLNHIREKLPDMKARLNTLMGQAQQELNSFGDSAAFGDANTQGALVLRLMTQFARDFVASIEGANVDISTKELSGGARIYYIFSDVFGNALSTIDSTQDLEDQDIRTAIRNSTGPRPSLFVPELAFNLLVKPQIKLLEKPSLRCVELVYEELVKICHNCASQELQRFPRLHTLTVEVVSELLRERLAPTSDYTQSLIEIQAAYINTNHPAFVAGSAHAAQNAKSHAPPQKFITSAPRSRESNGTESASGTESHESDSTDDLITPIGPNHSDARSVSSAHGRSRSSLRHKSSRSTVGRSSGEHVRTGSASSLHPLSAQLRPPSAPPGTAKESFLTYFFGNNGPGPISASTFERPSPGITITTARDIAGADSSLQSGLLASKNDGSSAAFDMKSLGRHIEATSPAGTVHLTAREEMETQLIRSLIASYFDIVRQSIQDIVPKAVMHLLVNHSSQQVQTRLVSTLYKPEMFAALLNEDENLVAERARVKALLDAYKDAFKTLSEVSLKSN